MPKSFKSKTLPEQLATIDRKLNMLLKINGVKNKGVKTELVFDEDKHRARLLSRKASSTPK